MLKNKQKFITYAPTLHNPRIRINNPHIRILLTTGIFPPDIGGPATYSALLFRELPNLGYKIKILTYGQTNQRNSGIYIISRHWPKGLRHILFFLKLLYLSRGADIVLAVDSSFGTAFISMLAAKILGKKFIVRVTGDYAWEQGQQRFGIKDSIDEFQKKRYNFPIKLLRKCQNFAVRNADKVIAPSKYLKKIVLGWGIKEENVKVIYNAISLPNIDIEGTKEQLCQKLHLAGTVIISAGRLVPWKGFELLIRVVADLRREISNLNLVIVGGGPGKQGLEFEIKKLKLENRIFLAGILSERVLAQYLKAADIFALNTAYEGFSHQIIEAMGSALPVVITDVGGNPEIVQDGQNGLLVHYNDFVSWKTKLRELIKNADLRQKLGKEAEKTGRQFSEERMILELKKTLEQI